MILSEKTRVIAPLSIFGPVEKYALISRFKACYEICESFQKRSMRSRTRILSANGPLLLSIPLAKGKTKQAIQDVEISYAENWQKDYLQGIRSAYASAAYFEYYFSDIENILSKHHRLLIELAKDCTELIHKRLQLGEYELTTDFIKAYPEDIDIRAGVPDGLVNISKYNQVFEHKIPFTAKLSILDLLFNLGPESVRVLKNSELHIHNK